MKMVRHRLALWLLARVHDAGTREALVGDLLEEIGRGRSRFWVWQQLVGWGGVALGAHLRTHARVSPHLIALALGVVLLGGGSIASFGLMLQAWLVFYLVSGTISLFAHIMLRTSNACRLMNFD